MPKKWWVIGLLLALQLCVMCIASIAIAFPNVFRIWADYGAPEDFELSPQNVALPNGERAWWFEHDTATLTVLVCHGRSRKKSFMLPIIKTLSSDHNVLAIDFPGHGENPFQTTSLGKRESRTVGDAVEFIKQRNQQEIVIFGVSMGGAATLLWAGENSDAKVRAIIVDGTFANLHPYLMEKARSMWMPSYLARASIALSGWIADYDTRNINPGRELSAITIPVLITHGQNDTMTPVDNAHALAKIAGKNAQLTIYNGGHDEPSNQELQRAILEFLSTVESGLKQ